MKNMTTIKQNDFNFPVGYHSFHRDQLFNFQLNRPYSWGYADFNDLKEVGARISNFADWKYEMTKLALDVILQWIEEKT